MQFVDIHEAELRFSELLEEAARGPIIITKDGHPIGKLLSIFEDTSKPILGSERGKIEIPEDFDAPLPDFERDFYGDD